MNFLSALVGFLTCQLLLTILIFVFFVKDKPDDTIIPYACGIWLGILYVIARIVHFIKKTYRSCFYCLATFENSFDQYNDYGPFYIPKKERKLYKTAADAEETDTDFWVSFEPFVDGKGYGLIRVVDGKVNYRLKMVWKDVMGTAIKKIERLTPIFYLYLAAK